MKEPRCVLFLLVRDLGSFCMLLLDLNNMLLHEKVYVDICFLMY